MASSLQDHRGSRFMLREDLELSAILRVLWFHKTILIGAAIFFGAAAFFYAANQEKTYRATALIEIRAQATRIITFGDEASEKRDIETIIENALVQLSAPDFLKLIVDSLKLTADPDFSVHATKQATHNTSTLHGAADASSAAQRTAIALLQERLTIRRVGSANVIAIDVLSSGPAKSARIANSIANAYLVSEVVGMEQKAGEAARWLENQITGLRGELISTEEQIIDKMAANQSHHVNEQSSIALRTSTLAGQLAAAKADTARAMAQFEGFKQSGQQPGGDGSISNAVLDELRSAEVLIMRRFTELSKEYGSRHPLMIALQRDLSHIRQRIQEENDRALDDHRHEIAIMQAREAELERQLDALKNQTIGEQNALLDVNDLEHRAEAKRAQLDHFLKRHRSLLEEAQLLEADGKIMSSASAPTMPIYPKPLLTSFAAACIGLLLASAGVFIADRWISDFGFKNLEELQDFGLTPLGIVPDLTQRESAGSAIEDYIIKQPLSSQAEAFQRLRTRLYQTGEASISGIASVMITSSMPLEGKTATAIALARQAAKAGILTLLIDADLRRPRIHDVLGVSLLNGLSDLVADRVCLEDSIVEDHLTPLHFLSAGDCPGNPADLFRSERMRVLLKAFEEAYEWVIIDTPPIGAASDCLLLGQNVGKTIYVARWRSSNRSTILHGVQELEASGVQVEGVVLSRVLGHEQPKYGDVDFGQYYGHYRKQHLAESH